MSNGTVELMGRTLANALGPRGITVNTIAPGATDSNISDVLQPPEVRAAITAITALGRIGAPADIADVVAFLASEQSRWMTGNLIDASGGMCLGPLPVG